MLRKDRRQKDFNAISIAIASPEQILSWSHGEVTKPETINYRTQKPERDGLFCERTFGPTKNYECYCGKYKKIIYRNVVCEKCGVEVTRSSVRRERMAHIDLAVPVTHIWFLRSTPSRIGLLLDLPIKSIEQVVYFAAYIITDVDNETKEEVSKQLNEEYKSYTSKTKESFRKEIREIKAKTKDKKEKEKKVKRLEEECVKKLDELSDSFSKAKEDLKSIEPNLVISEIEYRELSMKFGHVFRASIGAEAIRSIISRIDLQKFIEEREAELVQATEQKQKKIFKRVKLAASLLKASTSPEWMILTRLPVIPPDLRPMVQLDGGRYAASDLNDLYRRIINRNNRLKKLIKLGAPEVICRNEKRMLQEAVDSLLNNSARSGKAVFTTSDRRKLRSLSDMLKGKQGRFRQNLLGKRVDYSGRSVIVIGPELRLHQCGIPKEMALKLFKPFVIGQLIRDGHAHNVKNAERVIASGKKEVWDILENITKDHYVLLNRAPTLHRLSIQAFQPVLIDGKAIRIHPLVCAPFNADFDGDQMAVHIPISKAAQKEAKTIMKSSLNLLKPSGGEPITTATQDMVLGCYFLTRDLDNKPGEGKVFPNPNEAILAHNMKEVHLQAKIKVRIDNKLVETTVGKIIFNKAAVLPAGFEYKNYIFGKKELKELVADCFDQKGTEKTAILCDSIKDIGFHYATSSGITISSSDLAVPKEKNEIIAEASSVAKKVDDYFWKGWITAQERYSHNIRIWSQAKANVSKAMIKNFEKQPENDVYYQIVSGARGNWGQVTQLCGIKGLVANPSGRTIELPIKSNLMEGFTILEYFIATHGGRKGKSDTALKTAEAGYLTRRLVDAVQDIIVKEPDCGSKEKIKITREESIKIGEDFTSRIFGRVLAMPLPDPKTGKTIAKAGAEVDKQLVKEIEEKNIAEISARSTITCQTEGGICQMCYGRDLGTNKLVEIGTAVGIVAAQSIGEPGTQLTMRTFHMGGVAEGGDITQGLPRVEELFEARPPKKPAILSDINGKAVIKRGKGQTEIIIKAGEIGEDDYLIPPGSDILVKKGEQVKEKQILIRSGVDKSKIRTKTAGIVISAGRGKVTIRHDVPQEKIYQTSPHDSLLVENGSQVKRGDPLTGGHLDLRELMEKTDVATAQNYIISDVRSIYASQGQTINSKHVEIIVRQMFSKARVLGPGNSKFLPGEVVDLGHLNRINKELAKEKKDEAY
ncbi:MAG TPA: DNA-directed RNA polymerase subunit beta', partial [Candidatus Peregrinibacteria bacterium]|nr:DNA-directed RNA polymerase subunit beta' [Candidatus Peregrinibacteria bacterium]